MFRLSRTLIAFVFCFLSVPPQAYACRGASLEETLFFDAFPELPPDAEEDADVIAEVFLTDMNMDKGEATAKIVRVLKTSDARVREGNKIAIKFLSSSCGPHSRHGDKGIILTKVGADFFGRLVLCPYSRRFDDGRIFPPHKEVNECPPSKYEHGSAKQIKLKAEKGETEAQIAIRLIHEKRQSAEKKKREAMIWFLSEGGNMEGAAESQEAVKWFKLAAEQGDMYAQYYLGQMYQKGLGVERNDAEAAKWYRIAARKGDRGAKASLEALELSMLSEGDGE